MADTFTAAELEHIANGVLDYNQKGLTIQDIQDKPLLAALLKRKKPFPGGKDFITGRVKGEHSLDTEGWQAGQQVGYSNPTNIKEYRYSWKNIHIGVEVTYDELFHEGFSIVNTMNSTGEKMHTQAGMVALCNYLEDKFEELREGRERAHNVMLWRDGTYDSTKIAGVQSIILTDPSAAVTVGGIDQNANTWWRNRAPAAVDASTPSNLNITELFDEEIVQLRRYNKEGAWRPKGFMGSDFMHAWQKEHRAMGQLTQTGWRDKQDASMGDLNYGKIDFMYDPTLDDEGLAKYCFLLDMDKFVLRHGESEWNKMHTPARPYDRYMLHRSITDMGMALECTQRNTSGVYRIQ